MKTSVLFLSMVLLAIVQAVGSNVPVDKFLAAIAEVESGGDSRKVGSLGERGQYQFMQRTWQGHTRRPFKEAHGPLAQQIARQHYAWLRENLKEAGRQATDYEIALGWNAGLGSVLNRRVGPQTRDYAQRVLNLARS